MMAAALGSALEDLEDDLARVDVHADAGDHRRDVGDPIGPPVETQFVLEPAELVFRVRISGRQECDASLRPDQLADRGGADRQVCRQADDAGDGWPHRCTTDRTGVTGAGSTSWGSTPAIW